MRRRFTLIELLVVIAIIFILLSMLLPVLQKVKVRVILTECANRLKGLYMVCQVYGGDYNEYPASGTRQGAMDSANGIAPTEDPLEVTGYGYPGISGGVKGPYYILKVEDYLIDWLQFQCPSEPFSFGMGQRPGESLYFGHWRDGNSSSRDQYGGGTWFGYNGPNVHGPRTQLYGHNNALSILGGHFNSITDSWGLAYNDTMKSIPQYTNQQPYRKGGVPVEELILLGCPGLLDESFLEREPHGHTAVVGASQIQFGDRFVWQDPNIPISRQYAFGDGHVAWVNQDNRNYEGMSF